MSHSRFKYKFSGTQKNTSTERRNRTFSDGETEIDKFGALTEILRLEKTFNFKTKPNSKSCFPDRCFPNRKFFDLLCYGKLAVFDSIIIF